MLTLVKPHPNTFRHFDSAPNPSLTPIFESILKDLEGGRKKKKRTHASWKQLKFRIKLASQGIDQEALAIGILIKHPDWGVNRIAAYVGAHRGTLNRWKTFKKIQGILLGAAKEDFLASVPRGAKTGNRSEPDAPNDFDAWYDEEQDPDED